MAGRETIAEMINVLIVLELYIVFDAFTHKQNGKLQLKTEAQQFTQFLQLPENISRIKMQSSMRLDTFISFCSLSKARLHFTR